MTVAAVLETADHEAPVAPPDLTELVPVIMIAAVTSVESVIAT